MRELETKSAAGNVARGACYGKWSEYHPACSECMVWTDCKRVTCRANRESEKRRKAEGNPIEYMLSLLRGVYREERKHGDGVSAHCFKTKNGVKKAVVWVTDSGKVKVETAKGNAVFDSIESGVHVRQIFADNEAMKGLLS